MTSALGRIRNEITQTEQLHLVYIRSIEHREDSLEVEIRFRGPAGTKSFFTDFHILLRYPENYPYTPPTLTFLEQTHRGYHSMDHATPTIGLLDHDVWQIAYRFQDILEGIQYLLKLGTK